MIESYYHVLAPCSAEYVLIQVSVDRLADMGLPISCMHAVFNDYMITTTSSRIVLLPSWLSMLLQTLHLALACNSYISTHS